MNKTKQTRGLVQNFNEEFSPQTDYNNAPVGYDPIRKGEVSSLCNKPDAHLLTLYKLTLYKYAIQ